MKGGLSRLLLLQTLGLNAFLVVGFLVAATRLHVAVVTVVLIFLAFFGARNAGHAFNQVVDIRYDRLNPRTQDRPLVSGGMSTSTALLVVAANVALVVGAAALLNPLVLLLAPVGLALALGYSYTKRYTAGTTVLLGLVQSIIPAGVYLATWEALPPAALAGATAVLLFGTGFETIHSLGDLETDRRFGLHSLPLALGPQRAVTLVGVLFGASIVFFGLFGYLASLGIFYYAALVGMAIFAALETRFVARSLAPEAPRETHNLEGGSPLIANLAIGAFFFVGTLLGVFLGPTLGL